jgi:glutamyl-tRNA synthetase
MQIIGPDLSRARLRHAVNALGGFGKNKQKDLDKIYAKLGEVAEAPAETPNPAQ